MEISHSGRGGRGQQRKGRQKTRNLERGHGGGNAQTQGRGRGGRGRKGRGGHEVGGRGGGGGGDRQPDKDKSRVNQSFQVTVNAFELLGPRSDIVDVSNVIIARTANRSYKEDSKRQQAIKEAGLKPTEFYESPDGSLLVDAKVDTSKMEKLWKTNIFQPTTAAQLDETASKDVTIQISDAIHRAWDAEAENHIRSGNFVFSTQVDKEDVILPGIAVRKGHTQSIRRSQNGDNRSFLVTKPKVAPVTVQVTLLNFIKGFNFLTETHGQLQITNNRDAGNVVRGLKVDSHHPKYRIWLKLDGVQSHASNVGAKNTKFKKDGKQVSVYDHFKEKYNITLEHPNLPLAYRRAKDHFVYVPMELLSLIPGIVRQSIQSDEILKRSKMAPDQFMRTSLEKAEKTDKYVKHLKQAGDLILSRLSFKGIRTSYVEATALLLPTPEISVKDSKKYCDHKFEPEGNWNWKNRAGLVPPSLSTAELRIGFVNGTNNPNAMANCKDPIEEQLKIHTRKKVKVLNLESSSKLTDKTAFEILVKKNKSLNCLVVLLPESNNSTAYKTVKSVCDDNLMPSQCIKQWKRALSPQHARNLVLKMNAKLGGINHAVRDLSVGKCMPLQDRTCNTLIIGIDVYHGGFMIDPEGERPLSSGKAQSERPDSTLALAGFFGPDLCHASFALQNIPGGTEVMSPEDGFDDVIRRFLEGWRDKASKKEQDHPGCVIIYRDGIGTSSYDTWFENEIERGFRKVLPDSRLVVILSTKRHDVRFSMERDGRQTNLDSGTVVHDVPFIDDNSFYLQSYKALSAGLTAKAPHYRVFANDCGWSMRFIYEMTYALTHMQQRASGAIAIPAPVAAADMAAYRARCCQNLTEIKKLESGKLFQWFL